MTFRGFAKLGWFLMRPDDLAGGGGGVQVNSRDGGDPMGAPYPGQTGSQPASTPASTPTASPPTPAPAPSSSALAPSQNGAAAAGATGPGNSIIGQPGGANGQQQQQAAGLVQQLRSLGIDLGPQFADDNAALQQLALGYRQAQQVTPLAQRYAQHQGQFEQWLQQQQQAAAQAPAQGKKDAPWWSDHWKAPEFDPAWETQIVRDQNGNLFPKPGAAPDVVQKYQAYRAFREQQADKFLQNPYQYLEGGVTSLAKQIAQQEIQKHLGQFQEAQFANQFVEQHSSWIHQRDQNQQLVRDPNTGQPVLSAWGNALRNYVLQAQQMGLSDVYKQQQYALSMVQRDAAMAQLQGQQAPNQGDAAKLAFLQQAAGANRLPNNGGSLTPPVNPNVLGQAQNPSLSLADRLRGAFAQNGVTDADLAIRG